MIHGNVLQHHCIAALLISGSLIDNDGGILSRLLLTFVHLCILRPVFLDSVSSFLSVRFCIQKQVEHFLCNSHLVALRSVPAVHFVSL